MRQVLSRTTFLFRRPWVVIAALGIAGGGSALTLLPLFGIPGYELGSALAIAVGLLGGIVGGAAGFQERRLIQGRDPRPAGAAREDNPLFATYRAIAAATTLNALLLVPPLIAGITHAFVTTHCDPLVSLGFYPLLALPSALLAATAGVFSALATRRGWSATVLYLLLVLGSAALTVWPVVRGPQVFAFNHFGGYLPGPLYDEALAIRPALWWFRLETVAVAVALWLLSAFCLDMVQGRLTRPHVRPGLAILLGLVVLGILTLEQRAPALGFRMSEDYLSERLGGKRETAHFVITYPRGKPREEVDRLERDLEFRHEQLSRFLGGAGSPEKLRVFLYRSQDEKQLLVGAARTQFAKPWRGELHINDAPFPHPVVKHELVHLLAAPFGSGPFQVTTRNGLPEMGVVEGLAVAGDDPVDELTLHGWAAGMRRQKLAPDIRTALGPKGFYAASPQRVYTMLGSFLRYLADTHGPEKLTQLYAHGDFEKTYGQSLDALATEWEKFLDAQPLDAAAEAQAFMRFRHGSLFSRACVREVATAQGQAAEALETDPETALALFRRCAQLQPEDPYFALGEVRALLRLDRKGDAADVLREVEARVQEQPALAAEVAMARADVAYARTRPDEAREQLERALALKAGSATDRTARIKLAALDANPSGPAIWSYFRPGQDDVKLLQLRAALEQEPKNAWLSYLIGRRLAGAAPRLALGYLTQTLAADDLPDSLRRETLRLQLEATYRVGDCAGVRHQVGALPDLGPAFKARAAEWVERCDFEDRAFKGPLVPDEAFR